MTSRAYLGVLLAVAAAATFALWATRGWVVIGVPHFDPQLEPFSDAYVVLWGPEQCAIGDGEWQSGVCFVPSIAAEAHAQAYEPWLAFHRAGLGSAHLLPVAVLMVVLFYFAIGLTLRPTSAGETLLSLLLLATHGWHGVERANFDLLIAALLCLAARLFGGGRANGAVAGCLVLAVATMLKIYTGLAGAPAPGSSPGRADGRRCSPPPAARRSPLACSGRRRSPRCITGHTEGATRFSTGAHWLFRQRSAAAAWTTGRRRAGRCGPGDRAASRRRAAALRRLAAAHGGIRRRVPGRGAAVLCLKDSYDYRLVLWLPCLALPVAWLRGGVDVRWRRLRGGRARPLRRDRRCRAALRTARALRAARRRWMGAGGHRRADLRQAGGGVAARRGAVGDLRLLARRRRARQQGTSRPG